MVALFCPFLSDIEDVLAAAADFLNSFWCEIRERHTAARGYMLFGIELTGSLGKETFLMLAGDCAGLCVWGGFGFLCFWV